MREFHTVVCNVLKMRPPASKICRGMNTVLQSHIMQGAISESKLNSLTGTASNVRVYYIVLWETV